MTSRLQRVLAPLSVAAAFAFAAPAALATPTRSTSPRARLPSRPSQIVDPGASSHIVHLTVDAASHADLLEDQGLPGGNDYRLSVPVGRCRRRARRPLWRERSDSDLSTCHLPGLRQLAALRRHRGHRPTAPGTSSPPICPRARLIDFEQTGVDVAIVGREALPATAHSAAGLTTRLPARQSDDRRLLAGTPAAQPDDHGGHRRTAPGRAQLRPGARNALRDLQGRRRHASVDAADRDARGSGDDVQVVVTDDTDGHPLAAGTPFTFQVLAVRNFFLAGDLDDSSLSSPFSAAVTARPRRTRRSSSGPDPRRARPPAARSSAGRSPTTTPAPPRGAAWT